MSQKASTLVVTFTPTIDMLALLACAVTFGFVFRWRRGNISGTTLVGPWIWASASFASLVAVELGIAFVGEPVPDWAPGLRYAAAMSTFCPIVALLGAKRPQDRGWQWIVLTLWAILCQPAGEWILFGGVAEIHAARFWFLAILMLVGATNGLGTRVWLASLLYGGAQIILLVPYLASETPFDGGEAAVLGIIGIVTSWALVAADVLPGRTAKLPLDRVWLDFRDAFGVVWALRILERMNASANRYDWPVSLTWQGFCPRESATFEESPAAVEESFRTLLRRFVSPEWVDLRIGSSQPEAARNASPVS